MSLQGKNCSIRVAFGSILLVFLSLQGNRKSIHKDELKTTMMAVEKAHTLCLENKGSSELIADIGALFGCLK